MNRCLILGLMSGTSLDGLDLALCSFEKISGEWQYELLKASSAAYPVELFNRLCDATNLSVPSMLLLDKELGRYYAQEITHFLHNHNINKNDIDLIVSHGQTIYHQPENGFTYQIGCGDTISYFTGIKVLNDVRQKDVIAGGQGAPLVPIGEYNLFKEFDAFLNIGGFCNITKFENSSMSAFDVCPGNLPLNYFANQLGKAYDENGDLARSGKLIHDQYKRLNSLAYYAKNGPKSLGTEWLQREFYSLLDKHLKTEDLLCTITEHIAFQISQSISQMHITKLMVTGGGAFNSFLIERLQKLSGIQVHVPDSKIINFKEAIIFAFIGALYLNREYTTFPAITGAKNPVVSGVLHIP